MRLLNVGCGKRFHQDWINLDKNQACPSIKQWDASRGLPFSDFYFDVVYHSHVLEHFEFNSANFFLDECYRVLKKDGIIRIVVPDLEQIVRFYLEKLQKALAGDTDAGYDYNWIMLELYDQVVRESSGGRMAEFLRQGYIPNQNFIIKRCGSEVISLMNKKDKNKFIKKQSRSIFSILNSKSFFGIFREQFIRIILGKEYKLLEIGRFRCSGENHQWMYDRFSLKNILKKVGFVHIVQRSAKESYFPTWSKFNLDTEADGSIYKPDSLYMEAIKL